MQENISINKKLRSGIDLIEIKRLEKSYEKFGMRMLTRLMMKVKLIFFQKEKVTTVRGTLRKILLERKLFQKF